MKDSKYKIVIKGRGDETMVDVNVKGPQKYAFAAVACALVEMVIKSGGTIDDVIEGIKTIKYQKEERK